MRYMISGMVVVSFHFSLMACSFCSSSGDQPTLREVLGRSSVVLVGTTRDASIQPDGTNPTTRFTPESAIKGAFSSNITIKRYLPDDPLQPGQMVIFAKSPETLSEPELILPATPRLIEVIRELAKSPASAKLAFAFAHLNDVDAGVRADSFAEFARASDAEVEAAKAAYDPARLRKLLAGNEPGRHGVFAVLLGHCARAEDVTFLESLLATAGPALGGTLAGLTLADSKRGWQQIHAVAMDPKRSYVERFAAVNAARFVRQCRPSDHAAAVQVAVALLAVPELADTAAEDLRGWKCWEQTPAVLAVADLPTHKGRLVQRSIIRFALASPTAAAREFLTRVRQRDPDLVASVESADSP